MVNKKKCNSPSLLMPTAMHFFNLQYWHRFLLILRMEHCWFFVQGRYWIFCCMDRLKKPWGSQRQLESGSGSEPSLEQPESEDSRRASSMLTSTECRSRSSAVSHDITIHRHTRHWLLAPSTWHHHTLHYECTDAGDGRQRTVRRGSARRAVSSRDLVAGRRPARESESAPARRAPRS